MTFQEFEKLCEREYANGFGEVVELHLDEAAYEEMVKSITDVPRFSKLSALTNMTTGGQVRIIRHENHAVVARRPQIAATRHEVKI
jgi:hypothetical protein